MRKGLFMLAAAMLLSLAALAQNAETVNVSKERDGFFSQTYGKYRIEGNVKNGTKEGTWCEYNTEKNTLHRVIQFQKGSIEGLFLEMDDNGSVVNKTEYANGKKNGSSYSWTNGRLIKKYCYKNGELDGEQVICYDNGKNQEVSYYKDGKRDGVTTWYNREGNKSMMITYEKGQFEGKQETYYATGGVKTSKMFKNNVADGPCIEYYEGGDVKSESTYKKGELSGKVKNYDDKHPYKAKVAEKEAQKELQKSHLDAAKKQHTGGKASAVKSKMETAKKEMK